MNRTTAPIACLAANVATRTQASNYPEPFKSQMHGRSKRALGDAFGLVNFGVNLTTLAPGARSALRHAHAKQDEFIYVLAGSPTLITNAGETRLSPGMCAGFRAGTGDAHHLVNLGAEEVLYLEIGDRTPGEQTTYPDDDLQATYNASSQTWGFTHKDGRAY